ncbi:MAG: hypothetical protein QNJ46_21505 [Leptolyngbyaceae cyanobacterium MO_188.B28]|nr:hypothetical protein [Leptolyngbyaceae cyanobacterium MO_188.B28]
MTLSTPSNTSIWRRMMLSVTITLAIAGNSYLLSAPQLRQLSTVISLTERCLTRNASSPKSKNPVETILEKVGVKECSQPRVTQLHLTQVQTIDPHPPQLITYHASSKSGLTSVNVRQ